MRLYRWMCRTEPVALAGNTYKRGGKYNKKKNLTKTNLTKHTHKQRDMFMQGAEGGLFTNVVNNFGVTAYGLYLLCHVLTQFADPTETQQQQYNAVRAVTICSHRFRLLCIHTRTCVRCMYLCVYGDSLCLLLLFFNENLI